MLGTSDDTVYRMIKAGELTATTTGRSLRITRASAQAARDATRPGGPDRPDLLTLPQAAALAGVSKWVVGKHARTGKIRAVPWGKMLRYPRDQVAAITAPRQIDGQFVAEGVSSSEGDPVARRPVASMIGSGGLSDHNLLLRFLARFDVVVAEQKKTHDPGSTAAMCSATMGGSSVVTLDMAGASLLSKTVLWAAAGQAAQAGRSPCVHAARSRRGGSSPPCGG
jgi:excisionase family DNA binding protein